MSGKRSAACDYALRLYYDGKTLTESAQKADIAYSTLWRALHPKKKTPKKSMKDSA